MKGILAIVFIAFIGMLSAQEQKTERTREAFELISAKFKFEEETHDFGSIFEGRKVEYTFKFVNTGDYALNIYKVMSDCDCIELAWSDTAIASGQEGFITVTFDTTEKIGAFYKSIEILSDASSTTKIIRIRGEVKEDFFKGK
jgi:hypothetical protein